MRTLALTGILVCWLAAGLTAQTPLTLSGLPDGAPLTVTAKATDDQLIVELALEPEWHVYARDIGGDPRRAVFLVARDVGRTAARS